MATAASRRTVLAWLGTAPLAALCADGSFDEPVVDGIAPPLAAQYRATWQPTGGRARSETWTFHRAARYIALLKPGEDEVWLRDRSGVRLQRLFHADRKLVDYSAGELRTLRIDADWRALSTLFDERAMTALRKTGSDRFTGRLGDEQVTLQWDRRGRLPVTLVRQGPHGRLQLTRLAVATGPVPAPWPQPTPDRDDYDRLDAADFGDRSDDPFVRRLLAREVRLGWRQHGD